MANQIRSFVRRQGHFTDAQKKAYDELAKKYIIPFSESYIDFKNIFNNSSGVTLEIGFGSGFATAQIAFQNPCKNYIGIEVHRPGIGRLLREIEEKQLSNIKIIEYDAVHVMRNMIPPSSLDAIHIFFPDPWQKKRHRKRRLIQRPFTQTLANCLKPGGYLYMVTDWEDYALHALEELSVLPAENAFPSGSSAAFLKNKYERFAPAQNWRPRTRFEEKGLAVNHVIRELMFIRG
ncbi:MAG: tRNA (guanosine(46)-N7)-methyltransferase TrmB [Treponema sp.]|nr:tRNA (guanosine(46)-N7)-methyltransferase TrmB [Treponema sp.]